MTVMCSVGAPNYITSPFGVKMATFYQAFERYNWAVKGCWKTDNVKGQKLKCEQFNIASDL